MDINIILNSSILGSVANGILYNSTLSGILKSLTNGILNNSTLMSLEKCILDRDNGNGRSFSSGTLNSLSNGTLKSLGNGIPDSSSSEIPDRSSSGCLESLKTYYHKDFFMQIGLDILCRAYYPQTLQRSHLV